MGHKETLSRRDFLKVSAVGLGSLVFGPYLPAFEGRLAAPLPGDQIEKLIPADPHKIPILTYRYPDYEGLTKAQPLSLIQAHLDFLTKAGYTILTDKKLTDVESGKDATPVRSVALRTDRKGQAFFDEPGLPTVSGLHRRQPVIDPSITRLQAETDPRCSRHNPLCYELVGGHTFNKALFLAGTPITPEAVAKVTGQPLEPLSLTSSYQPVPGDPEVSGQVARMLGIIIHTDSQPLGTSAKATVYNMTPDTEFHYAIGSDQAIGLLPAYKQGVAVMARGATGGSSYFSIELAGNPGFYNRIGNDNLSVNDRWVITKAADNAIAVIAGLLPHFPWIDPQKDILGHYEFTTNIDCKPDPGIIFMDWFRKRLVEKLS